MHPVLSIWRQIGTLGEVPPIYRNSVLKNVSFIKEEGWGQLLHGLFWNWMSVFGHISQAPYQEQRSKQGAAFSLATHPWVHFSGSLMYIYQLWVAINNNHLLFGSSFTWKAHCQKAAFPQFHRWEATEGKEQSVRVQSGFPEQTRVYFPVLTCFLCFSVKSAGNAFCAVHLWRTSCVLTPNLSSLMTETGVPNSEKLCKLPVLSGCLVLLDHISILAQLLEQEFFLLWGIIHAVAEFVPFSLTPWGCSTVSHELKWNPRQDIKHLCCVFPSSLLCFISLSVLLDVSDSLQKKKFLFNKRKSVGRLRLGSSQLYGVKWNWAYWVIMDVVLVRDWNPERVNVNLKELMSQTLHRRERECYHTNGKKWG